MRLILCYVVVPLIVSAAHATAAHPHAADKVTTLTNEKIRYSAPNEHFVILKRGPVTAVIVDNEAVDVPECPKHKAGYNGIAVLRHAQRDLNLFVPGVAGLNFEHIHDGTLSIDRHDRFEPRKAPMQLRMIDEYTVELHQPPTPWFKLESCGRYRLLDDGTIEYTFECIPRAPTFSQGYIGLFWASYMHQPESLDIHFVGRKTGGNDPPAWIRGITPKHGIDSTHPPAALKFEPKFDPAFSLTLANHRSNFVYAEPWYYGVNGGIAWVQMFRARDAIWFAQSPTGGGTGNPAWDFQWFIPDYKVGEAYGFTMRGSAVPFRDRENLVEETRRHRDALQEAAR